MKKILIALAALALMTFNCPAPPAPIGVKTLNPPVGDGNTAVYSGTTGRYIEDSGAAPVINLDDLADVNAPAPADEEALVWDAVAGEWVPAVVVQDLETTLETADESTAGYNPATNFTILGITNQVWQELPDGVVHLASEFGPTNLYLGDVQTRAHTGTRNILGGWDAGDFTDLTSSDVIAIGTEAAKDMDLNNRAICIGYNAAHDSRSVGTGSSAPVYIGSFAGKDTYSPSTIAIGYQACGSAGAERLAQNGVWIGWGCGWNLAGTSDDCAAVGYACFQSGQAIRAAALGRGCFDGAAAGSGDNSVSVGYLANRDNDDGDFAIAIGSQAGNNEDEQSFLCLGYESEVPEAHCAALGGSHSDGFWTNFYFGAGELYSAPPVLRFLATAGSGTDVAGSDWEFWGARPTGDANAGEIAFFIATNSPTSGTALRGVVEILRMERDLEVGFEYAATFKTNTYGFGNPSTEANKAKLWAQDEGGGIAELDVIDGAGTKTTLSPHNTGPIPTGSDPMPVALHHWNDYLGREEWVYTRRMAELLEEITGEQLIYFTNISLGDWDADQLATEAKRTAAIATWDTLEAAHDAWEALPLTNRFGSVYEVETMPLAEGGFLIYSNQIRVTLIPEPPRPRGKRPDPYVAAPQPEFITFRKNPTNALAIAKSEVRIDAKREALRRIVIQTPSINTFNSIELLAEIWPMLNTGAATPQINNSKALYTFVKGTVIPDINSKTTAAQVRAIDVVTDYAWPF